MSLVRWGNQNFTDSAVLAKLERQDKEEKVGEFMLFENCLTSSPPLTSYPQFDTLRGLDLEGNKLREVRVRDMPLSVEWVDLSDNDIKVLGNWSGHTKMWKLIVSKNPLIEIRGLPSEIEKLALTDCPVEVLHRACFRSENAYNVIKNALSPAQISKLKQPPPEVFKRGYAAIQDYYSEATQLVLNSRNRLILLGETEAGKSSLMESLLAGKAALVDILDRTQVVDIKRWPITPSDVYMVYDQGGHEVYTITNHLFIAKQATVVLVHDITKITEEDIQKSVDVFLRTLQQHPTIDIHVALTHIDKLDEQTLQQNITKFKDAVATMYRKEINNFGRLIKDMNGKKCEELHAIYQKKEASIKYFEISSLNYQGVPELKTFLSQTAARKRVAISDKWVTCFKLIAENEHKYLTFAQVEQMIKKAYGVKGHLMSKSKLNALTINFLRYLSDTGLVLWFEDNPQLKQYVFHNLEYIVELLKTLFHHDLLAHLHFKSNTKLQKQFTESEFERILSQYEKEGLLHYKLISAIWNQYGMAAHQQDTLVELLKAFSICYGVGSDNSVLYFPWFVRRKQPPEHINLASPVIVSKQHTTILLQCVFYNRIPSNIFEMLSICLQRQAVLNNYIGDRYSWNNGLVVEINDIECIVFRNPTINSLLVCLRGRVTSLMKMWEISVYLFQDLQLILAQWQGVLENQFYHCVHCVHRKVPDPRKWLPSEVLGQKKRKSSIVRCNKEEIPEALVVSLSGITNIDQAVSDVEAYLQENCAGAPRQLEHIQCIPQGDDFKLSWEVAKVAADKDSRVVIEYREPEGQWQQHGQPVMGTSCVVSGLPEGKKLDFRVRPENQASEDHTFVIESQELQCADELLSEEDKHKLLQYHTLFIRMTSLSTVLHKMCVRGVINDRMLERLRRKLTRDGPIDVAEDIVEHIKRLKYTHLYKFKKTLEETGQLDLANKVPLKLKVTQLTSPDEEQVPDEKPPTNIWPPSDEPFSDGETSTPTSTPSEEESLQDDKKSTTTLSPCDELVPPEHIKQKLDKSSPRLLPTENEPGLDETSTPTCTPPEEDWVPDCKNFTTSPPTDELVPPVQPKQEPSTSSQPLGVRTTTLPSTKPGSIEGVTPEPPKQKPSIPVTKFKLLQPTVEPTPQCPNTAVIDRKKRTEEVEPTMTPKTSEATPMPIISYRANTRLPLSSQDTAVDKRPGLKPRLKPKPQKTTSESVHKPHHSDQPCMGLPLSTTQTILDVKTEGQPTPESRLRQPPEPSTTSQPLGVKTTTIPSPGSFEGVTPEHPKQKTSTPVTKFKLLQHTVEPTPQGPNTTVIDRKKRTEEVEPTMKPRTSEATPMPIISYRANTRLPLSTQDTAADKRPGLKPRLKPKPQKTTSESVHKPHHSDQPSMGLPLSTTQTILDVKKEGQPTPEPRLRQMTYQGATMLSHLPVTDDQALYNHPVLRELQTHLEKHMEPTEQLINLLDLLGMPVHGIGQCNTDFDKVRYILRTVDHDSERLLPVLIDSLSKCEQKQNNLLASLIQYAMSSHSESYV